MSHVRLDPSFVMPPSRRDAGNSTGHGTGSGHLAPWMRDVIDGHRVFIPGVLAAQMMGGGFKQTTQRRGLRLRTRRIALDGVEGLAVWGEKL